MNAMVLLATLSVLGVAALFLALASFLVVIARELEEIGGPATLFVRPINYLSKIRMGVRAIERQTDALVPHVTRLNGQLSGVLEGLQAIDANLEGVIGAVSRQGGDR
jgi:hypothetical protein